MNHTELTARINAETQRCLDLAEKAYGRKFAWPQIDYSLRGRAGGVAQVRSGRISLNGGLLKAYPDTVIGQTLPHEIAHLIDYAMHPQNFESKCTEMRMSFSGEITYKRTKRNIHGATWKAIMALFGKPANRCHDMDTTLAARTVRKLHTYTCECGREHQLGPKHHAAVTRRGQFSGVRWKSCGMPVERERYVGLSALTVQVLEARAAQAAAR